MAGALTLEYTPISLLCPERTCWLLKAKVTQKFNLSSYQRGAEPGNVFTVTLMDEEGITMAASFFDQTALRFFPLLHINQVYEFEGGEIKPEKPQYRKQGSCYHLTFNERAKVKQLPNGNFRPRSGGLVQLSQLATLVTPTEKYVDVVAVVHTIHLFNDGSHYKKRDLELVDPTGYSVQITMWGELAKDIVFDLPHTKKPIIYCSCVKLTNFANVTLSAEPGISEIFINPIDNPFTTEIEQWRNEKYPSIRAFLPLTTSIPPTSTPIRYVSLKSLQAVRESSSFLVRARVRIIKADETNLLWFNSCPTARCWTELIERDGQYYCQNCQILFASPIIKYRARLLLSDSVSQVWTIAYDEAGKQLFEVSAFTLKSWSETQADRFQDTLAVLLHRELCCRLQVRIKENSRKCVLVQLLPASPGQETSLLLSDLLSS